MEILKKSTIVIAVMVIVAAGIALDAEVAYAKPERCVDVCIPSPCFGAPRCPDSNYHCRDSWGWTTTCCAYCPD